MVKPAIKIFLDSNVILSGLLSEKGSPRVILDLLCLDLPGLKGATGEYNLREIERNIQKRLPDGLGLFQSCLPRLRLEIVPLTSVPDLQSYLPLIVAKDAPVLEAAVRCGADYLVTGDKRDFDRLKGDERIPLEIVNPVELVKLLGHALANDQDESR